jgi:hypothetical protein
VLEADQVAEIDVGVVFASSFDSGSPGTDYVSLAFYTPDLLAEGQVLGLRFV